MGLRNSAQSFQRLITTILCGIPNLFIYLDDLFLYNKNEVEHKKSIELVLQQLQENGLTLNLKKCRFGLPEIDYLGYRVNGEGITPLRESWRL